MKNICTMSNVLPMVMSSSICMFTMVHSCNHLISTNLIVLDGAPIPRLPTINFASHVVVHPMLPQSYPARHQAIPPAPLHPRLPVICLAHPQVHHPVHPQVHHQVHRQVMFPVQLLVQLPALLHPPLQVHLLPPSIHSVSLTQRASCLPEKS